MIAMSRVTRRRSQGRMRRLMKPSMTICPASVPVSVAFWPEQRSKQRARHRRVEERRQELVRVRDVGHVLIAGAREGRGSHHENRAVNEEREHERHRRIDRRKAGRFAFALEGVEVLSRLYDRRVQIASCAASRWCPGSRSRCTTCPGRRGSRGARRTRPRGRQDTGLASQSSTANEPAMRRITETTSASTCRKPWC